MANFGSSELAVLLSHLSASPGAAPAAAPNSGRTATPSEAMALYFVAARLVELQLELANRGGNDLSAELATTREVLEGTRRALVSALEAAETQGVRQNEMPGPPTLSVVEGGRARRKRARKDQ